MSAVGVPACGSLLGFGHTIAYGDEIQMKWEKVESIESQGGMCAVILYYFIYDIVKILEILNEIWPSVIHVTLNIHQSNYIYLS